MQGEQPHTPKATDSGPGDLLIGKTLSEAWARTDGVKGIVIGGGLIVVLINAIIQASVATFALTDLSQSYLASQLMTIVSYPLVGGICMVCVRHSVGEPVAFSQLFMYYNRFFELAGLGIVIALMTWLGYLLLILPGIYLTVATYIALPLCLNKKLGIIDAIKASIGLVNPHFWTVLGLMIIMIVIIILSFVTVIGWIWGIPLAGMIIGIIYRQLAGIEHAG